MHFTRMLAFAGVVIMLACGGSPTAPSESAGSTMNVRITDNPFGSAKAVLVTFAEVAAQRSGGGWSKLPFAASSGARTCDLKKLENRAEDLLASGSLEPGTYTMLRITIQSAKIFFDNNAVSSTPCGASIAEPAGAAFTVAIPTREVTLNGTFTITENAPTTILIDFDGAASIVETGNRVYTMNPVIRIMSVQ